MNLDKLRDRWADPLLTALTILLVVMLFVVAPLQAQGIFAFQVFELVLALFLVGGVFFMSGSRWAVIAMLVALAMVVTGAVLRIRSPSILDLNLFAASWLIMGVTMGWVVARATFAPGRITYHRVIGAVLLYLTVAVIFASLYTFVGTLAPKAFSGMIVEDNPELASRLIYFSASRNDGHHWLWRRCSRRPDRAQPVQSGSDLRPALSRDAIGAAGDARTGAPGPGFLLRQVLDPRKARRGRERMLCKPACPLQCGRADAQFIDSIMIGAIRRTSFATARPATGVTQDESIGH